MKKIIVFDLWHPYRLSFSWSMARILSENFEICFFTTEDFPPGDEPFRIVRLPIRWPEKTSLSLLSSLPCIISKTVSCRAIVRSENPDLIYFAFDHPLLPFFKLPGIPIINTAHELDFRQGITSIFNNASFMTNLFFCDAAAVMNSRYYQKLKRFGLQLLYFKHPPYRIKRKIHTEHNAVQRFLFFGKIRPDKGLEYLLEACCRLQAEKIPFKLTIAGQGNLKAYHPLLDQLRETTQIINRFIRDDEIEELIDSNDIAVLPYKSSTQSGVEKLFLSSGMPLIISEAFYPQGRSPDNVYMFSTGDVNGLTEKMKAMITSAPSAAVTTENPANEMTTKNILKQFTEYLEECPAS